MTWIWCIFLVASNSPHRYYLEEGSLEVRLRFVGYIHAWHKSKVLQFDNSVTSTRVESSYYILHILLSVVMYHCFPQRWVFV